MKLGHGVIFYLIFAEEMTSRNYVLQLNQFDRKNRQIDRKQIMHNGVINFTKKPDLSCGYYGITVVTE